LLARLADGLVERNAVTKLAKFLRRLLLGLAGGVARRGQAADLGFERRQTRGAFRGGACGTGGIVLRFDQAALGAAVFLLGGKLGLARGIGGSLGRGVSGERLGTQLLGGSDVRF